METKQQRIEKYERLLAEAKALPDATEGTCFVPAIDDCFSVPYMDMFSGQWKVAATYHNKALATNRNAIYLRPEYAPSFVKAMDQIFQFRAAEGCVPADELVDGTCYWNLTYNGGLDYWVYDAGSAHCARFLVGHFTDKDLLRAARDRICGGAAGAIEMMRNFHGVRGGENGK